MRPTIRSALLASAMALTLLPVGARADEFSNFIVFGDSLVDSGQFPDPARFLNLVPGLPEGARLRFTNRLTDSQYGLPYSDVLAGKLGFGPTAPSQPVDITSAEATVLSLQSAVATETGLNYAVGGQTTREVLSSINGAANPSGEGAISRASIVGLPSAFDASPANDVFAQDGVGPAFLDGPNAGAIAEAVALISAGGNDVRGIANVTITQTGEVGTATFVTDDATIATSMREAAANTVASAQALSDAGAALVIVPNLPNIGAIPENTADVGVALQALGAHQASLAGGGAGTLSAAQVAALAPLAQAFNGALATGATQEEAAAAATLFFSELRAGGTTAYNSALAAGLDGVDGNVMQVDLEGFFDAVVASPGAFGFAPNVDHSSTCYNGREVTTIACLEDATLGFNSGVDANGDGINDNANPLAFVFNDGIHPTTAAAERTAEFIHSMMVGADAVAVVPFLGISAGRALSEAAKDQADAAVRRPGLAPFIAFGAGSSDYGHTGEAAQQDALFFSGLGGVSYGYGNGVSVGVGVGVQSITGETSGGQSDIDGLGYFGVAFLGYERDRFFGSAALTGGFVDYDVERASRIGNSTFANEGSTNGTVFGGEVEIGARLYDGAQMSAGPIARLGYWSSDVDGYTESGADFSALRFGDGGATSFRGAIGGFLETDSAASGLPVHFRAEALYAHEFDGEGDDVVAGQASLNGAGFSRPGRDGGDSGVLLGLQLGVDVGPGQVGFGYSAALFDDEDEHAVRLSYRLPI